jgi:RecJ-like exonuclease
MKINTEKCNLCFGNGFVNIGTKMDPIRQGITVTDYETKNKVEYENILCPKCKGTGCVDWVSRVTNHRQTDVPLLEELTDKVHVLIKERNIFGTDGIVFEQIRRKLVEEIEKQENQLKGEKDNEQKM